jgi:hypothetical protein
MGAAEKGAMAFHSVANNAATAVIAHRGHQMDGAFEAIKGVPLFVPGDFKTLVVFVPACFASCHVIIPLDKSRARAPRTLCRIARTR